MNSLLKFFLFLLSTSVAVCTEIRGKVTDASDGTGVGDAIVYAIAGPDLEKAAELQMQTPWKIQGGRLVPKIYVAQIGKPLIVSNDDKVGYELLIRFDQRPWQNRLIRGKSETAFTIGGPDLFAHASGDLGRLHGYVCVLKYPVYAITDNAGSFRLQNLQPGVYTIEVAHRRLGKKLSEVTIPKSGFVELNLVLKPQGNRTLHSITK